MTKLRIFTTAICGVAGLGLLAACAENTEQPMTPASGVAPRWSAADAVSMIVAERCTTANRCGEIGGEDAAYASMAECKGGMNASFSQRYATDCNNGVADRELKSCVKEIRNEDCGGLSGSIDAVDRYMSCSPSQLCLD